MLNGKTKPLRPKAGKKFVREARPQGNEKKKGPWKEAESGNLGEGRETTQTVSAESRI